MAIDLNDPLVLALLDQYINSTDAANKKYTGNQILRPVLELEHQGRVDGFDVFSSCLKLIVSTVGASSGSAAEGLVIAGGTTTGNLLRIFNQQENLIDYTTNVYCISYDGRHGIMTPIADVIDARLEIRQAADIPCVIVRAFSGGVQDLLQMFNQAGTKITWVDHDAQLHWVDSQGNEFVFVDPNPHPVVNGLLGWGFPPNSASGTAHMTEGTVYLQKFYLNKPTTLSSLMFNVTNAANAPTAAYGGLYSTAGTRLAVSANSTASFTSTGAKTLSFTSPYVAATGYYYTALIVAAGPGQGPDLSASTASSAVTNINLTGAALRYCTGPTGQTSLPTSITMSSNVAAVGLWTGVK